MTYLGQENDFVKSSYSLTLFEAFLRHLLEALTSRNACYELLCGMARQLCWYLTKSEPDLLISTSRVFLFFNLNSYFFLDWLWTIKPINRMIRGTIIYTFASQYYIINQRIMKNSQVTKKKLTLKNQEILLIQIFLVHNSKSKNFPDTPFRKIMIQNNIYKNKFPESNDKTFREIKKFQWGTVPIVQEKQNAVIIIP